MFRKISVATGAALLALASFTAVPASAATKVSNGVACSKSGASTKVSGTTYKCAKNALVKNSKLTWLSVDCINTASAYVKSKANLPKIKAESDATVANLDADILKQQTEADKAAKLIPEYQAKIVVIQAALTPLKADTANLVKNKATISKYEGAIKSYEAAIKAYGTVGKQISRTQAAKEQAQIAYENAATELSTGLEMAKLVCTKGY